MSTSLGTDAKRLPTSSDPESSITFWPCLLIQGATCWHIARDGLVVSTTLVGIGYKQVVLTTTSAQMMTSSS